MREPSVAEFFISTGCVCVYIDTADGRACRVQFDSREGPGTPYGAATALSVEAAMVATRARQRYLAQLLPLFERVEQDRLGSGRTTYR